MEKYDLKDLYSEGICRKINGLVMLEEINSEIPFIMVEGSKPGKTILITAGIHGGEYTSIVALQKLAKQLRPEEITGKVILLPIINSSSFYQRMAFLTPEDKKNLNRCFIGDSTGTYTEKLADCITKSFIRMSDIVIDCHGGDLPERLLPHVYYSKLYTDKKAAEKAAGLADKVNVPFKIASDSKGSLYYAATKYNIPSLLVERGDSGQIVAENVSLYMEDLTNLLRHLNVFKERAKTYPVNLVKKVSYLYGDENSCWQPLLSVGKRVQKGEIIGFLLNTLGEIIKTVQASESGVVLYFITSYAVTKGDLLCALAVS